MIDRRIRAVIAALAAMVCGAGATSCVQGPPKDHPLGSTTKAQKSQPAPATSGAVSVTCREQTLPWGSASGQVGSVPQGSEGKEQRARGPMAVAVDDAGRVCILDNINRRVIRVDGRGSVRVVVTGLDKHAADLSIGSDGSLAVLNLWKGSVSLFDPKGHSAGTLTVARVFRHVKGLRLGPSRQVSFRNAYQETFLLGSPGAPLDLAAVLRTKKEGAFMLDADVGLAVRRQADGNGELMIMDNGPTRNPDGRHQVQFRRTVHGPFSALRLVGVAGQAACMKLERVTGGNVVSVQRRARCIDIASGESVLDMELPEPGLYLPRRELAAGGQTPMLSFIHPRPDGLRVKVCTVPQRRISAQRGSSERRAVP